MFSDLCKTLPQFLLPKKLLTEVAGILAGVRSPWLKNFLIRQFVKSWQVNMNEAALSSIEDYPSFNDFFIRPLKEGARPLADAMLLSPVDGILSEFGDIEEGKLLQAKGRPYTVASLLSAPKMTSVFAQGKFASLYLSPKDYHRVHMPIDGQLLESIYVPGKLFSVQPATVRRIPHIFAKNERLVCFFHSPVGLMAMVLVGATIVGKIGTAWAGELPRSKHIQVDSFPLQQKNQEIWLHKGEEMGYFKLGSTVILLFSNQQALQWNPALEAGSTIRLGQALMDILR